MSVELLQTLSLGAYILAGVFLAVTIALFFLLDVPKLVGFLTGSTAKRGIETIQHQNEGVRGVRRGPASHTGEKTHRRKTPPKPETSLMSTPETEKLYTEQLAAQAQKTVLLSSAGETELLDEFQPAGETTVLEKSPPTGETTVLEGLTAPPDGQTADGEVAVEVELGFAESTELIE